MSGKTFEESRGPLGSTELRAGHELLRSWAPQQTTEETPFLNSIPSSASRIQKVGLLSLFFPLSFSFHLFIDWFIHSFIHSSKEWVPSACLECSSDSALSPLWFLAVLLREPSKAQQSSDVKAPGVRKREEAVNPGEVQENRDKAKGPLLSESGLYYYKMPMPFCAHVYMCMRKGRWGAFKQCAVSWRVVGIYNCRERGKTTASRWLFNIVELTGEIILGIWRLGAQSQFFCDPGQVTLLDLTFLWRRRLWLKCPPKPTILWFYTNQY